MSLGQTTAQMMEDLVVEEQPDAHAPALVLNPNESGDHVVVYIQPPAPETVMELHDPEVLQGDNSPLEVSEEPFEVSENHPEELSFEFEGLPGADHLDPAMEKQLEVVEAPEEEAKADDDKKSKVPPKWDWQAKGAKGFIAWVKERLESVPQHSGYDTAGVERALSYLNKLDSEISKAMRLDVDGELDANKIEEVRSTIDNGIEMLHERIDKISKSKKSGKKKKKASIELSELGFVKEAQKIPGITGIVVTVPLFISSIVRTCINGEVSAGHDMSDMFKKLADKFNLDDKQIFECMQLFADMGWQMRSDRGYLPDEDVDYTSSDNFDFAANYQS